MKEEKLEETRFLRSVLTKRSQKARSLLFLKDGKEKHPRETARGKEKKSKVLYPESRRGKKKKECGDGRFQMKRNQVHRRSSLTSKEGEILVEHSAGKKKGRVRVSGELSKKKKGRLVSLLPLGEGLAALLLPKKNC